MSHVQRPGIKNNKNSIQVPCRSLYRSRARGIRQRLLLGVEDTGCVNRTPTPTYCFLLFSSFFCPFIPYCFTSSVSSTPSRSLEKEGFSENCFQLFSVQTTQGKFENATGNGHFRFVFEENSSMEIKLLLWCHRFRKAPFSECFSFTLKHKFLRFEKRLRKAPFSKCLPFTLKQKFLRFEKRLRKAPFSECFSFTLKHKFLRFEKRLRKAPFSECLPFTLKHKFLRFEKRLRKAKFSKCFPSTLQRIFLGFEEYF